MNEINIRKINDNYPYDLLLLADETKEGIHKYLFESEVYTARLSDSAPIGVFCLYPVNVDTIEIMNIAVSEQYQNMGIGSHLLAESFNIAKDQGYKEVIVGTADCGIKQIRFYERNGFIKYDIRKNYFTDIYDIPIYENGIQLRDMVMLRKTIIHEIQKGEKADYSQLMTVWESSVKETHHFLRTEDFEYYKKIIPNYFPNVNLYVIRSGKIINAFMGISGDNLEMLFVSANSRGKGYGKSLLLYALDNLNVKKVDVNEQNFQAVGFYERFGFKVISRSEKDSMGKDYPILHLSLREGKTAIEMIALKFNECITNRDIGGLSNMMTENHVFIDMVNNRIGGKMNCIVHAWKPFFALYPNYQNIFENIVVRDTAVIMQGYSVCSEETLNNCHAIWVAEIVNNKVALWQIYSDTKENREMFKL
jgi:ribosomal protein S18 acetylase RimI-like enzyme